MKFLIAIKNTNDKSKNTIPFDFLMMGELFQNNHHWKPKSINFSSRWFEIDPGFLITKILNKINMIRLNNG